MRLSTNKLAWRYLWPDQCYSGTLATGGGLLFVGRNGGPSRRSTLPPSRFAM